jgi:hypothetical protein
MPTTTRARLLRSRRFNFNEEYQFSTSCRKKEVPDNTPTSAAGPDQPEQEFAPRLELKGIDQFRDV